MMFVSAKAGPDGPFLTVTGNHFRAGEVSSEMSALGIPHQFIAETDNRARLIIPMPVPAGRKEGKAK